MLLNRLIYRSDSAILGPCHEVERRIDELVRASHAANAAVGLSGALLLSSGVFVQVLEGPMDAVEATFERICCDLRHRRVQLLEVAIVEERVFDKWPMARARPTTELARLAAALDVGKTVRLDSATSGAVIELMRTLLLVDPPTGSPARAWRE